MNTWRLTTRSLRHYWRAHLGVLLGVTCAATVLVGALAVGDSVRSSLRDQALQRIGRFDAALAAGDRFVGTALADRITAALAAHDTTCVPLIQLPGTANRGDRSARAGIVDVFGVDDRFFAMSSGGAARAEPAAGHALINARLARQLAVAAGEDIVVRVEKPSLMPREATMATVDDVSFALRVTIDAVLTDDEFSRFGLRASQVPPHDVFVSLAWLQRELELPGRANLLAIDAPPDRADAALRAHWTLADAELGVRVLDGGAACELTSERVFLEPAVLAAVAQLDPAAIGVFTYFVNAIRAGAATTPYSMVSAIGPLGTATPAAALQPTLALAPAGLAADEIVLNDWTARDLGVAAGATVEIEYMVLGPLLQLEQRRRQLRVHSIVPLAGAAADAGLMPPFPGLFEARSCADWDPGVPVELDRLDDADQAYWQEHRGTPKAFVRLQTGRELWSNRFGSLTAVRAAAPLAERFTRELPRHLDPADLGLFFQDLRGPALAAAAPATDFGGLFLGLSFFLILAGLLLTTLLFVFGTEQRSREIGTLLAVGWQPRAVRRQFVREALLTAGGGSVLGALLGVGYCHAILGGLGGLWRGAVGQTTLNAHIQPLTIAAGAAGALLTALAAIALTLRQAFGRAPVELLGTRDGVGVGVGPGARPQGRIGVTLAIVALVAATLLVVTAGDSSTQTAATFFGAGALVLVGTLLLCRRLLHALGGAGNDALASIGALGRRNSGRRPGRSLATIALLASGTFLVVAVQANRLEPPRDTSQRASGTGGFAWFGRSALPVLRDLDSVAAREAYALDDDDLAGTAIVPLRVRDGDDASCLNLSRPQNPRLVGVDPEELTKRMAFRFTASEGSERLAPWSLLDAEDWGPDVVPAIGDAASVTWTLHKSLGESLRYRDEAGAEFEVRIVGTIDNSILQGNLVIADRHLRERFPSASGFRMFLIDAPADRADVVAAVLTRAFEDIGLELTSTRERLAAFQSVQNTYLSIFQLLGGLGLLLGGGGLGVVVLRNALERRSELATLAAVGFAPAAIRRLVWTEHGLLLALGLGAGVLAAVVAVQPVVRGPDALPIGPMAWFLAALAGAGALSVWLASAIAVRGPLLDALGGD